MNYTLLSFQRDAALSVLAQLDDARLSWQRRRAQRHAVGLAATTGAGKTVIAAAIIEAILKGSEDLGMVADPTAVFLWITDQPALNKQAAKKMFDAASDLRLDDLVEIENDFTDNRLSAGKVYFINTQKLGARADLTKRGPTVGRAHTFWDIVRETIDDPEMTIYLVIDEAHRGMTEGRQVAEANSIIQRFIFGYPPGNMPASPIVLGISATPSRFERVIENSARTVAWTEVPPAEVRESGLIKDRTIARYAGERQTDAMALFPEAVRKWSEATQQWEAYHADNPDEMLVLPALVIQVENEADGRATETDLATAIRTVSEIAGPLPDAAFAHAFGEPPPEPAGGITVRYVEPHRIAADSDARVVFFKMGLGTGWDCPRAEVLFSFRRAVDPTTIAQTIGRMVRSPLARRIEDHDSLNSAYVYLPHYDENAVNRVVAHLNESGNGAIGAGVRNAAETAILRLRGDAASGVEALNRVPSYDVPARRRREAARVLADLAAFLARNDIDLDAVKREMRGCAELLLRERDAIGAEPRFAREVDDQADVIVRTAVVLPGAATVADATEETLPATEESIRRVFAASAVRITGEVASAYVRLRLAQDPTLVNRARLEVYALTGRETVMGALTRHAAMRIDALRQQWGGEVEQTSAAKQTQYRRILRQAPTPTERLGKVVEDIVVDRGTVAYDKHLFVDDEGRAPIKITSSWERDALADIVADPTTLFWVRNPARSEWGLCLPRREGNAYHPFFPAFLVIRDAGDRAGVDIIDPHDWSRPDAVEKAKGLSWYAARHAEQVGHVDLIAKVDGVYRTLHMERMEIRAEVDVLGDTSQELKNLLVREG
jgi:type III restriction enzyme